MSEDGLSNLELGILQQLTKSSLPDMGKVNALELTLALSTLITRLQKIEKTLKLPIKGEVM